MKFSEAIRTVRGGVDLTEQQTASLIDAMLSGVAVEDEIGQLLLAMADKGESVDELVGAAKAMRRRMTRIEHSQTVLLDTCGTGGSGSGTFNISTAVAIVVAACGVPVAKHGNRAATSKSGSADVLEQLGVSIESDAAAVGRRLDETGLCFCFAPVLHPAMKHVVGVRRRLGVKTLFNLLGPLCNPAGATHQLLGTSSPQDQRMVAEAMSRLDTTRSLIVHAEDGQDEVSLASTTTILDVSDDGQTTIKLEATDFDLPGADVRDLQVADPAASAEMIRGILAGHPGPPRDTVVAGAATALWLVGRADRPWAGTAVAAKAIDSGRAAEVLEQLRGN